MPGKVDIPRRAATRERLHGCYLGKDGGVGRSTAGRTNIALGFKAGLNLFTGSNNIDQLPPLRPLPSEIFPRNLTGAESARSSAPV